MTTIAVPVTSLGMRRGARPDRAAVVVLGLREARRLLTHPVWLVVIGYFLLTGVGDILHGDALLHDRKVRGELLGMFFTFLAPVISLFPANLVATSGRRSGADAMLDAAPLSRTARTVGCAVAAVVCSGVGAVAAVLIALESRPRGTDPSGIDGLEWAQIASIPLLYLGAGLLGVAVARWLPWPGMAFLTVVLLVTWTGNFGQADSSIQSTIPWIYGGEQGWIGSETYALSHVWHAVYLICLCALAATAAILRERVRLMVALGAVITLATVGAGIAQLP